MEIQEILKETGKEIKRVKEIMDSTTLCGITIVNIKTQMMVLVNKIFNIAPDIKETKDMKEVFNQLKDIRDILNIVGY